MKCISLWQPWASLMAFGAKRFETRSWATKYRGPLAIHAAKKWNDHLYVTSHVAPIYEALRAEGLLGAPEEDQLRRPRFLPLGCILCVVNLVDCLSVERLERANTNRRPSLDKSITDTLRFVGHSDEVIAEALNSHMLSADERAFGDYTPGRFVWVTTDLRKLSTPIPLRGRQGLFDLPLEIVKRMTPIVEPAGFGAEGDA